MINLKTPEEIQIMREGGRILAEILDKLAKEVKPGIATQDLDKLARELILFYAKESGKPVKAAFLGYDGFPAALCVSINEEVVHGVPSKRILKEGEVVSLDMGIVYKGLYLDSAITLPVLGETDYKLWAKLNPRLHRLLDVTKESLNAGINEAKVGNRLGKVSHAVQAVVERSGFGVIRDLVGHGIGRKLHEEPQVPNYGSENEGVRLEEGMVVAIEPMVSVGDWRVKRAGNSFTYVTYDASFAAHFEHTVAITKSGPLVLTKQ
jgi:methionyl aminopeptidase